MSLSAMNFEDIHNIKCTDTKCTFGHKSNDLTCTVYKNMSPDHYDLLCSMVGRTTFNIYQQINSLG